MISAEAKSSLEMVWEHTLHQPWINTPETDTDLNLQNLPVPCNDHLLLSLTCATKVFVLVTWDGKCASNDTCKSVQNSDEFEAFFLSCVKTYKLSRRLVCSPPPKASKYFTPVFILRPTGALVSQPENLLRTFIFRPTNERRINSFLFIFRDNFDKNFSPKQDKARLAFGDLSELHVDLQNVRLLIFAVLRAQDIFRANVRAKSNFSKPKL